MKIRTDYVSNSSSSSFVIFGNIFEPKSKDDDGKPMMTIEDFAGMDDKEAYFIIIKEAGSEGDYIIPFSPELLMDCDMHQINLLDIDNIEIIKGVYTCGESGYLSNASSWLKPLDNGSFSRCDPDIEELHKLQRSSGVPLESNLKIFHFDKDYGNPDSHYGIIEALQNAKTWNGHNQ